MPEPDCFLWCRITLERGILLRRENLTYKYWAPVAAATRGFKMVVFTASRRNNFVGGTCAPPSALQFDVCLLHRIKIDLTWVCTERVIWPRLLWFKKEQSAACRLDWFAWTLHTASIAESSKGVFIATQLNWTQLIQLNSVQPSHSCFYLWRHDLQTESTVVHAVNESTTRRRVEFSCVQLCRYKHPLSRMTVTYVCTHGCQARRLLSLTVSRASVDCRA